MAESDKETIPCGPCDYEHITKQAAKWCCDCGEGYCDECLRVHKAAKMSRHHHLVAVAEYQKFEQLAIPQVCQIHQKVFEYFCPGHDSVICIVCVQSEHSKCLDLLSLQNAAKGAKTSTALNELEQNINHLLENIENGIKMQDKNLNSILDSDNNIRKAVREKHEEIIKYFEKLQEKTYVELKAKYGQCQQEISSSKDTYTKKKIQLQKMKNRIFQMKECLSDVQAFVEMKMMTENINDEKEVVKSLVTDVSSVVLKFELNPKIETNIEKLDTYGKTLVSITRGSGSFVESKVGQAQLNSRSLKSVESIKLQLRTVINTKKTPSEIQNCLILPNKQMMILETHTPCLIIYNENGSHDRDITVPTIPFDATVIDRKTLAVTFGNGYTHISIIDIKTNRIDRNMENAAKQWCWGISHDSGKLYVVCYGEGINVLDLSGCIIKTLSVEVTAVFNIVATSKNVFYTDEHGTLFSLDTNGSKVWEYSSALQNSSHSSSITADEGGNLYVVGEMSNVLLAVSKDGKKQKVLLTENDGLKRPNAVFYSVEHKLLLVCNRENGCASLFDIHL